MKAQPTSESEADAISSTRSALAVGSSIFSLRSSSEEPKSYGVIALDRVYHIAGSLFMGVNSI